MLGEKLKELRESKGLLQRQVAVELKIDTAYISKMESNDKPVSDHYKKMVIDLIKQYGKASKKISTDCY